MFQKVRSSLEENVIIVRVWEGLGNQLFQYAYARSLKERGNCKVYLECRRIYRGSFKREDFSVERFCRLQHFNISLKTVNLEKSLQWKFLEQKTLKEKVQFWMASHKIGDRQFVSDYSKRYTHFEYQPGLYSFTGSAYVMGHFLNLRYFENIRAILLEELRLKEELQISDALKRLFEKEITVSVHIRRTDFINRGYCISSDKYYERAMNYIKAHVERPCFLFFSDDIEWVRENYCGMGDNYHFVSNGCLKDYEELMLMCQCKHNIIANSTFSFWGAWLNTDPEKIVIAPKKYAPTFIPEEWIRL